MSSAATKRERRKPDIFNPADFDVEAAESRSRKRVKDKDRELKRKTSEESFQDITDSPASLLQRRISV